MGMGETEINLVVVVDVPVQTAHDLVRRGFQRISLITSRIIVVFFRQVLADVVHPYEGTVAYRCGVLERTVHNAVCAPFVIGAATRYARRACLHIILIFAVHEEEQFVFNDRTSQRSSVGGAVVTVAGQFIVLYLVSGEVGIGSVHIGCTFELIRTTLCHGVDGTSCKSALTDIKGGGGNGNLFQSIQRDRRTACRQVRADTEGIVESGSVHSDIRLAVVTSTH